MKNNTQAQKILGLGLYLSYFLMVGLIALTGCASRRASFSVANAPTPAPIPGPVCPPQPQLVPKTIKCYRNGVLFMQGALDDVKTKSETGHETEHDDKVKVVVVVKCIIGY